LLGNSTEEAEEMDLKQEITQLSATVDAELQTASEPTHSLDDLETNSSDNYINDLTEKADKCSTSLTNMEAQIAEGEDDFSICSDNDWQAEHEATLGLLEEYCTTFGWDNNVPEEFETANDLLLQSNSEYSEFIRLYRVGLSEVDEEKLAQSLDHMLKGADFTIQAYGAMP